MSGYTYNRGIVRGGVEKALEQAQKDLEAERTLNDQLLSELDSLKHENEKLQEQLEAANARIAELESKEKASIPEPKPSPKAITPERPHAHFENVPERTTREPLHVGNLDKKYWGESEPADLTPVHRSPNDRKYWGESTQEESPRTTSPRRSTLDKKYWGESNAEEQQSPRRRSPLDNKYWGESYQEERPRSGRRANDESGFFSYQEPKAEPPIQSEPPQKEVHSFEREEEDKHEEHVEKMESIEPDEPNEPSEKPIDYAKLIRALENEEKEIERQQIMARPSGMSLAQFRRHQTELEQRYEEIQKEKKELIMKKQQSNLNQ